MIKNEKSYSSSVFGFTPHAAAAAAAVIIVMVVMVLVIIED